MSKAAFGIPPRNPGGILPDRSNSSWAVASVAILDLAFWGVLLIPAWLVSTARETAAQTSPQSAQKPDPTFDGKVREDMFSGMTGDSDALARAMKTCEDALAKNPEYSEALAWHGVGLLWEAGQAFLKGEIAPGKELSVRGHAELDHAVSLLPDSVTVLIPRGAVNLENSKHIQIHEYAQRTLEQGLGDYEKVLKLQEPYFNTLAPHSRGELLSGLAEGWWRAGNSEEARKYAQRIVTELPGSRYAARSQAFLDQPPKSGMQLDWHCLGCHR